MLHDLPLSKLQEQLAHIRRKTEPVVDGVRTFFREQVLPIRKQPAAYIRRTTDGTSTESPETSLTAANHALWIGKFPRHPRPGKDIYSVELLEAMVDYIASNLAPGETGTIIMSQTLSELMNGGEDIALSLSTEEEKTLLRQVIRKRGRGKQIEIVDLEESAAHRPLFARLRAHWSPEKGVAMEEALAADPLPDLDPTLPDLSLRIAQHLYAATKKHPAFYGKFESMVTKQLKPQIAERPSIAYYGLVEMAVRLAELATGRTIHGGADRQSRYDEVIRALMQGSPARSWKPVCHDLTAVRGLFNKQGFDFTAVYIDTEENYFLQRKNQIARQKRLAIRGLLVGTLAAGAYFKGSQDERSRQEQIDSIKMEEQRRAFASVTFTSPHTWTDTSMDPREKVLNVRRSVETIMEKMRLRLNLPPKLREYAQELLEQDLIEHPKEAASLYGHSAYTLYLERFLRRKGYLFKSKGVNVVPRHEQIPIHPSLLIALGNDNYYYGADSNYDPAIARKLLQKPVFSLSIGKDFENITRLDVQNMQAYGSYISRDFSGFEGGIIARALVSDLALADLATIDEEMDDSMYGSFDEKVRISRKELLYQRPNIQVLHSYLYNMTYEVVLATDYSNHTTTVLAAKPGEAFFTTDRAKEAHELVSALRFWHNREFNRWTVHSMPDQRPRPSSYK